MTEHQTTIKAYEEGTPEDRTRAIARIVELLVGPQPGGTGKIIPSAVPEKTRTIQTKGPISFEVARERIVGQIRDGDDFGLLFEDGSSLKTKTARESCSASNLGSMTSSQAKRRSPMVRNHRPGKGGRKLKEVALRSSDAKDFGQIEWQRASGGAHLGQIHRDPEGDTVIMCRVSSDEQGQTLVGQLEPTFALCEHQGLRVKLVILAENMSGTWEVLGDRESNVDLDPKVLRRDDIHLLDEIVRRDGWPRNVVLRGADRIAREELSLYSILRRWKRFGLSLWLAEMNRKVNYRSDKLELAARCLVSSHERDLIVERTQRGALTKGPLAGKGWLGSTKFGFVRDEDNFFVPDLEQWPFILRAFELADVGLTGDPLSTRDIAKVLSEEGCTFDHESVRKILKDPVFANGEFSVRVRGLEVAQRTIPISQPVPIDRFQRVQNNLVTRGGASSKTPAGEFLFNRTLIVHKKCQDSRREKTGQPSRVRGYIIRSESKARVYRHHSYVPRGCYGVTWQRDDIEKPIVEYLRELAKDPQLVSELVEATRPDIAGTSARLTDEQKDSILRDIGALEDRRSKLAREYVIKTLDAENIDAAKYEDLKSAIEAELDERRLRLERDEVAAERERQTRTTGLERKLLDVLTIETPTDPQTRILRARVVQESISKVVIDDDDPANLLLTIYGPLVPINGVGGTASPVERSAFLFKDREELPTQTALSSSADKAVWTSEVLSRPSGNELARRNRLNPSNEVWCRKGANHLTHKPGEPAWRAEIRVPKEKIS